MNALTVERSKNADEENFPVGSQLIAAPLRKHVAAFYDFARTADDIADSPDLSASEKLQKLNDLEEVLRGRASTTPETLCAAKLRLSLLECNVPIDHARDLLKAFRMDASGKKYETFDDLIVYCRYSAAAVGRFMLDLHKESPSAYFSSDALCAALQINNHLQDCKKDYLTLNRVYLPQAWFDEQGLTADALNADRTNEKLRAVFDRAVSAIEGLLTESAPIPMVIRSRGLRMEVCVIYKLAQRLAARLKTQDILAQNVSLRKSDWFIAGLAGVFAGLRRKKLT